jgi:hypothetical protein
MLIISFDAVGDKEFERLMEFPAFSSFSRQAAVFRGIPTMCLSNTYPIHASVVTGVSPNIHGIISNTEAFPAMHPIWVVREDRFRVKTLWQGAAEQGIETATVSWPGTAFSKSIRYNYPEIMPRPGKNPIIPLLKAGSALMQVKMLIRHARLLDGFNQPERDGYTTACMVDLLRENKPGLALMHLSAFDALCHTHGRDGSAMQAAFESLDRNLALLLEAAGDGRDVLVFSDHSQVDIHTTYDPNGILVEAGLLRRLNDAYLPGESGCYFECCGGTAFFHAGSLSGSHADDVREGIERSDGFRRFLTHEELFDSGYEHATFGFSAEAGYCYIALKPGHKAEHGYPPDMPDYQVFYMAKGFGLPPGSVTQGGSLLDIAPLAARRLGFDLPAK